MTKEKTAPSRAASERRYVVSTGLRVAEDGDAGRFLHVLACVKREVSASRLTTPEIDGWFTTDKLPQARSAYCGECRKPHPFFALLDALDAGILPLNVSGDNPGLSIDVCGSREPGRQVAASRS